MVWPWWWSWSWSQGGAARGSFRVFLSKLWRASVVYTLSAVLYFFFRQRGMSGVVCNAEGSRGCGEEECRCEFGVVDQQRCGYL